MESAEIAGHTPLADSAAALRELTQAALAEMRALIFELRPDALAEEGLVEALSKQGSAITARTGVQMEVAGPAERLDYSAEVEEHLYRIALEALNNSIKHAQAAAVRVNITAAPSVEMLIADDGTGFDTGQDRPRHLDWGPCMSAPRASVRL